MKPLDRHKHLARGLAALSLLGLAAAALSASLVPLSLQPTEVSSPQPTAQTPATITDDLGRPVIPPTNPKRIVALVPFAADMLLDLGIRPALVPEIRGGGPDTWADIPTVSVDHSAGPSIEQIVAAAPDLVIATSAFAQFLPTIESAVRAPIIVLDVNRLDDVSRHLRTLGAITGKAEKAEDLAGRIDRAASELPIKPESASPTKVLAIFGTPHAFYGFLPDTYMGDLVRRAGGQLVTEGLVSHKIFKGLTPLSMEAIVAQKPEVVLVVFHGSPETARAMLARDEAWNRLPAVKSGRIHIFNEDNYVMHPGRNAEASLARIAEAIGQGGN
jgi:iron complex transport system substrate-binding protein